MMETPIPIRRFVLLLLFASVALNGASCDRGDVAKIASAVQAVKGNAHPREVAADNEPGHKAHLLFDKITHQGVGQAPTLSNMVYPTSGGGPVMRNPTNYLIFWQPPNRAAFPAGYIAAMERYFDDVGGTPFYNIVTQYGDKSGAPVPNSASLGAPGYLDTTTAAPSGNDGTTAHPLTDGDIRNEVTVALAANPTWARPSDNVEYFVFTPSDVDECFNSSNCFAITGGSNGTYCAYHTFFNSNTIYSYIPFASNGSCYGSPSTFPNGAAVDVALGVVSHEMIESNTDPLLNAWKGPDGLDDEIGDKCAYIYDLVAPDGTNIVLHGDRYQVQTEWSNAITGCAKRYGPTPGTSIPGTLGFGEVPAGASAEMDLVIQNLAGGDLDVLNVRLDPGSSPYYSLLGVPPTSATVGANGSMTIKVKLAPPANAPFSNPTASVIVTTDDPAQAIYTTNVTGQVGVKPVAICQDTLVQTDPHLCTTAIASVNSGSFDPDGEGVTGEQEPDGPYTLGTTPVLLVVTDNGTDQQTDSCSALITVQDLEKPALTCPEPQSVSCTSASGASVQVVPTANDNCPGVTASCNVPPVFPFGSTQVTCTATDGSGNTTSCQTAVTVTDVPPVISSVVASPNILLPPNKKLQNVTILAQATDVCDPAPSCAITGVTASKNIVQGVDYVITGPLTLQLRASGNGGHPLTYQVKVTCTDAHGGSTSAQTSVQAPL